ncbi:hypothetical protein GCM10029964_070000 [Kibdelosporangium lantanae]
MWKGTQEYVSVYRQDALGSGESVMTTVTRQDNTGPWARAGIMLRGSVVLARTPGNGIALQWDSTGKGSIDRTASIAWAAASVWLKLTRSGTSFTGYASSDGTQWQQVGAADVPGAPSRMDAGLFVSAVNADGVIGTADFTGLQIVRATRPGNDLQRYQEAGRVVAAPHKDGRLELYVAAAGGVWQRSQTAVNAGWGAWKVIGGPAGATLAVGRDTDGTLELYATNAQGTWLYNGSWQDTGGPGGRDVVMGPAEDGRLEVFVAATDGVWHRWRTPAGAWSGWQREQGPADAVLALGREAGGTLVLFASGSAGTFQRDQYAVNAGWGPWLPIGPAATDLTVVPAADSRLELHLAGGDGVLHRYQGTPSGDWTAFTPVGGPGAARLAGGRDPDGLIQVVAVTPGEAWQRAQSAVNGGWAAWSRTGTGGSDVDVATNEDGRLEAHAIRPDQVWVRYQRGTDHAWSDWQPFGSP